MSKAKLLAVAFTDVNGNDTYNPGKDMLIAALQDTDLSGSVTLGDTVIFGSYPHLNGHEAGTFQGADTTAINVIAATDSAVVVGVAGDSFVGWSTGDTLPGAFEAF